MFEVSENSEEHYLDNFTIVKKGIVLNIRDNRWNVDTFDWRVRGRICVESHTHTHIAEFIKSQPHLMHYPFAPFE